MPPVMAVRRKAYSLERLAGGNAVWFRFERQPRSDTLRYVQLARGSLPENRADDREVGNTLPLGPKYTTCTCAPPCLPCL